MGKYEGIKVVLCATHDTASAVEGISMDDNHLYISSGTWSLLGVKTDMAHVRKSVQELRAGKGTAHELIEVDDE